MKLIILLRWLWLNLVWFVLFFLLTWILIILFQDFMLRLFGQWAEFMRATGAKNLRDFSAPSDMFTYILTMNGVTVIIYFVIGLFLQSPLVMLFTGVFYSCIAFLAPFTIGRPFNLGDRFLISVESFTLILAISVSSALAGDLFDVKPDIRGLLNYWKHNWNKFLPKPVDGWKLMLRDWSSTVSIVVSIIIALL